MAGNNAINAGATGIIRHNGSGVFDGVTTTQYNALIGASSNGITSVAPSATSGVPIISQGSSANPTFGTAVVAGGGTGLTSATAYAVLCGGTSSTGALQSIAGVGVSGQVLTSNGASALPTFQTAASGGAFVFVSSASASNSSSITFTSLTASSLYYLNIRNLKVATDLAQVFLRVSTDNGSSYAAVDYQYDSAQGGSSTSATAISLTGSGGIGNATGEFGSSFNIFMHGMNIASNPLWVNWQGAAMSESGELIDTQGAGVSADDLNGGSTQEIDAIQIICSTGNISSGEFYLYRIATS